MRKVIFAINMSLDGCVDHTKFNPDEELLDYWTSTMREAGTLVYGRKTYQLMVPFWPDMAKNLSAPTPGMHEFAQAFDAVANIIVFSRTLEKVGSPKIRIVRANPQDEILKLKQEPGGDIFLGGVDIPSQLMAHDLVDEYRFVVTPVIAGDGVRLMNGVSLAEPLGLKLVESKVFKSGCVALRYSNIRE